MLNLDKASGKRALIAIIALAVLLRVVAALYLGDRVEPISGAYDQVSYDALAQRLLAGHGFSFPVAWYPFTPPDQPTAHWSYLYTLYLAGVYAVFGHHPLAARLLQAIVAGVLHPWLAYRLALRLFDGETRRGGASEQGSRGAGEQGSNAPRHPLTPSPHRCSGRCRAHRRLRLLHLLQRRPHDPNLLHPGPAPGPQPGPGDWQIADGRWQMADGKWPMADRRSRIANRNL